LFAIEIFFIVQECLLKGGNKMGDEFFGLQLKSFIAQEFVLKGDRKWVMLCLVFSLFAIGLFYCSKVCF
jgi:hypothetical protein